MKSESKLKINRKMLFRWSSWFSLFNFFVVVILVGRYLTFTTDLEYFLQFIYIFTVLLGHASVLVFLPFLMVFVPVILITPRQTILRTAGVCIGTIGVTGLILDFDVYSQYRFHLNGMVFDFIINGGREIFDFSWVTYTFGALVVFAVILLQIFFSYLAWEISKKASKINIRNKVIFIVLSLLISSNLIHAWADASYYRPITSIARHLPLLRPVTAKRFMEKYGFVNLDETWKLNKLSERKIKNTATNYPVSKLKFKPDIEPLNVVFIVIDSWRFDMLDEKITPNINQFIQEFPVLNFKNHTSGGNGTRTGIFSMFYGVFGSYWRLMETEQIGPVFIKELLNRDYQMGVFASSKLTSPAFNQTVFSDVEDLRFYSDGDDAWERDLDTVNDWESWLQTRDTGMPFFNFFFFDSAHAYAFPPDYERPFTPILERVDYHELDNDYNPLPFINRYKTSLHFIDSLIGKVLSRLAKEKILEESLIVITSDHGQEFNDNKKNYWGHGSNFTKYQINVPLIIYWPGKDLATYTHLTNHVDLTPTIIKDLLKCENQLSDYSNGRSLFGTNERQWIFSGGGLSSQAIIEKERITELFNTGGYEIFTHDYSVKKDAKLNPVSVKESIIEKRRFYK